ncbi:hypothetical protein Saa2_01373 [Streptomyces acidiscabies]|nr:hypothetical protein Saa2_01373 [Streptomyces acidiscabies]
MCSDPAGPRLCSTVREVAEQRIDTSAGAGSDACAGSGVEVTARWRRSPSRRPPGGEDSLSRGEVPHGRGSRIAPSAAEFRPRGVSTRPGQSTVAPTAGATRFSSTSSVSVRPITACMVAVQGVRSGSGPSPPEEAVLRKWPVPWAMSSGANALTPHDTEHFDSDHQLPGTRLLFPERSSGWHDSGVVAHQVHPPVLRHRAVRERGHRCLVGHVRRYGHHFHRVFHGPVHPGMQQGIVGASSAGSVTRWA